jgi:hypothetical protein
MSTNKYTYSTSMRSFRNDGNIAVKYTWIINMKQNPSSFLANSSREYVRVMGTIVDIQEIPEEDAFLLPLLGTTMGPVDGASSTPLLKVMTLDDGTETISIWTHQSMIEALVDQQRESPGGNAATNGDDPMLLMGLTLDCILKLRQSASHQRWFAETLIPLHSTLEEEQQYRWILLSHHDKYQSSPTCPAPSYAHRYGFPTRRHDTAQLYKLISANAKIQQKAHDRKQQKENQYMGKRRRLHEKRRLSGSAPLTKPLVKKINTGTAPIPANSNNVFSTGDKTVSTSSSTAMPKPPPPLKGLTLENLACVMRQPEFSVQKMIQELQLDGRIYRNSEGEYLPL